MDDGFEVLFSWQQWSSDSAALLIASTYLLLRWLDGKEEFSNDCKIFLMSPANFLPFGGKSGGKFLLYNMFGWHGHPKYVLQNMCMFALSFSTLQFQHAVISSPFAFV